MHTKYDRKKFENGWNWKTNITIPWTISKQTNSNEKNKEQVWMKNKLKACFEKIQGLT